MLAIESFLRKEQTSYKKNSPVFKAINQVIDELSQNKPLQEILDDEDDPIKKRLPSNLKLKLQLFCFNEQRIIEDTFIFLNTKKADLYLMEIIRRLFDAKHKKSIERAFEKITPKIGVEVRDEVEKTLKLHFENFKKVTECYLKDCTKATDAAVKIRKKAAEEVYQQLTREKLPEENNLTFYRNRIEDGLLSLNKKRNGTSNLEKIKQDKSPSAKRFLVTVAIVSSLLLIGILPTFGAMLYSKTHYNTVKFWKVSSGFKIKDTAKNTEKAVGLRY